MESGTHKVAEIAKQTAITVKYLGKKKVNEGIRKGETNQMNIKRCRMGRYD